MTAIDPDVPASAELASKPGVRQNFKAIKDRIGDVPDSSEPASAAHVGKVMVYGAAGERPVTGTDTASLAGAKLVNHRLGEVEITANTALSDAVHGGRLLKVNGSSDITLTVNAAAIDGSGCSPGFHCTVWRYGEGGVAIEAGSGLTLRHPDDHTHLGDRWSMASIGLSGTDIFLAGKTAT